MLLVMTAMVAYDGCLDNHCGAISGMTFISKGYFKGVNPFFAHYINAQSYFIVVTFPDFLGNFFFSMT